MFVFVPSHNFFVFYRFSDCVRCGFFPEHLFDAAADDDDNYVLQHYRNAVDAPLHVLLLSQVLPAAADDYVLLLLMMMMTMCCSTVILLCCTAVDAPLHMHMLLLSQVLQAAEHAANTTPMMMTTY